jgi:dolichol kinase
MTKRDEGLLGISAATFLLLCVWLGPHVAFYGVVLAVLIALWVAICRRWPFVGYCTAVFLGGFLSGLFGYRSGYRRRRW